MEAKLQYIWKSKLLWILGSNPEGLMGLAETVCAAPS
jgi:hypothetical protein